MLSFLYLPILGEGSHIQLPINFYVLSTIQEWVTLVVGVVGVVGVLAALEELDEN